MLPAQNRLLARLSPVERARLLKLSEWVDLKFNDVLSAPGQILPFVYFPTEGFISLVTRMAGEPVLEVGMVGTEGMFGAELALGRVPQWALHPLVQGAGHAWRMPAATFEKELDRSTALRRIVHSYLQITMSQLATSAACLRFHKIEPRLARWLLMTHDRAHSNTFQVTHKFLAFMLGMRRAGITTAAAEFQRRGMIKYQRGVLTILNRRALRSIACSCYAEDQRTYDSFLGLDRAAKPPSSG